MKSSSKHIMLNILELDHNLNFSEYFFGFVIRNKYVLDQLNSIHFLGWFILSLDNKSIGTFTNNFNYIVVFLDEIPNVIKFHGIIWGRFHLLKIFKLPE